MRLAFAPSSRASSDARLAREIRDAAGRSVSKYFADCAPALATHQSRLAEWRDTTASHGLGGGEMRAREDEVEAISRKALPSSRLIFDVASNMHSNINKIRLSAVFVNAIREAGLLTATRSGTAAGRRSFEMGSPSLLSSPQDRR